MRATASESTATLQPTSIDEVSPGEFRVKYNDGSVYEGELRNPHQRDGKGVCTFTNGDKYDGYWMDDKMHGQGCYWFVGSNKMYKGQFNHGELEGYGKYILTSLG